MLFLFTLFFILKNSALRCFTFSGSLHAASNQQTNYNFCSKLYGDLKKKNLWT